jgi:hypothetical protein
MSCILENFEGANYTRGLFIIRMTINHR